MTARKAKIHNLLRLADLNRSIGSFPFRFSSPLNISTGFVLYQFHKNRFRPEGSSSRAENRRKAVDCEHSELDRKMARSTRKIKLFNGRDYSWMQFNRRVLEEAEDPANPLLERVKFLAITGSNLDEYVEVRQAGLMQRIEDGYREPGYDGLRPDESLDGAHRRDSQLCGRAIPLLEQAAAAGVAQAGHSAAGVGRAERATPASLPAAIFSARSIRC